MELNSSNPGELCAHEKSPYSQGGCGQDAHQELPRLFDNSLIKTHLISLIMQNAKNLGWTVEQQTGKVYVLRKNIFNLTKKEKNTSQLIDLILDVRHIK